MTLKDKFQALADVYGLQGEWNDFHTEEMRNLATNVNNAWDQFTRSDNLLEAWFGTRVRNYNYDPDSRYQIMPWTTNNMVRINAFLTDDSWPLLTQIDAAALYHGWCEDYWDELRRMAIQELPTRFRTPWHDLGGRDPSTNLVTRICDMVDAAHYMSKLPQADYTRVYEAVYEIPDVYLWDLADSMNNEVLSKFAKAIRRLLNENRLSSRTSTTVLELAEMIVDFLLQPNHRPTRDELDRLMLVRGWYSPYWQEVRKYIYGQSF